MARPAVATPARFECIADVELSARVPPIDVGRQLPLEWYESAGLTELGIDVPRIARAALRVDRALIELAAIGRIGEPDAAVRMGTTSLGELRCLPLKFQQSS